MEHKEFKYIYASTSKQGENIALHLLTNWSQHEKVSDEQMLDDYDSEASSDSPSLSSDATASWTLDASTAIN